MLKLGYAISEMWEIRGVGDEHGQGGKRTTRVAVINETVEEPYSLRGRWTTNDLTSDTDRLESP